MLNTQIQSGTLLNCNWQPSALVFMLCLLMQLQKWNLQGPAWHRLWLSWHHAGLWWAPQNIGKPEALVREIQHNAPMTLLNCSCVSAGVEFGLPPFRVDSNEMGRWFTAGLKYAQV